MSRAGTIDGLTFAHERSMLSGRLGLSGVDSGAGNIGAGNIGAGNVGAGNVGAGNVGAGNVGAVALRGSLPRLAESGCSAAAVEYSIVGGENAAGRPCLRIAVRGNVTLQCQRCMQPLVVAVGVSSELELAESREAAEAADDDVDRVVASRSMEVAALVEDELLLALPMVPLHEACEAPAKDEGARPSAFAALEKLRRGGAG